MNIKLLTEYYLQFLNLKGDCTGSSESTLVKMQHCWKSHVAAHFQIKGAQWLSGRVLDSRPVHCVVVLEQDTFILA